MKGFSVLESMVSVAIISIMAVSMWVGYGNWRSRSALNAATQKMVADIRRVQNLAVSTGQIRDPDSGSLTIPCGYGIHYLNPGAYILFANKQNGLDLDCRDSNRVYVDSQDINIETVNIEQRNIDFSGVFDDILFFPPDPLTLITESSPPDTVSTISNRTILGYELASITLCFSSGSLCKNIEVRETGLIDIQ